MMQAVMNAFETRGFPVAMTGEGARVMILEEPLAFGIEEGTKTVAHRVSYTEQRLIDRGLGYQVPKVDHVPSGQLSLVITNVRHVRQRWSEGSKPLEEMLNKFIIGLGRAARRASNDHRDSSSLSPSDSFMMRSISARTITSSISCASSGALDGCCWMDFIAGHCGCIWKRRHTHHEGGAPLLARESETGIALSSRLAT